MLVMALLSGPGLYGALWPQGLELHPLSWHMQGPACCAPGAPVALGLSKGRRGLGGGGAENSKQIWVNK